MLNFKAGFSLLFYPQRPFIFSSLSAIRELSDVIDISPGNLDSSCVSSNLTLCMMYSVDKLNKHGDNIQPKHTFPPVLKQSIVPCSVLIVAS